MSDLPHRLEPASGYREYKVTSLLKDYLASLLENADNRAAIDEILNLINAYRYQLGKFRNRDRIETIKEVYKAIDKYFDNAPEENKKEIQCKAGCTACCFIDVDISEDEAMIISNYCNENGIEIDKEYLEKQAAVGRKKYSELSRCVFLKEDSLCGIYPVRPVACRKHWVKTDPSLCDFSKNVINQVAGYFDINTEILASALLNAENTGTFEKMILDELKKDETK
ncbi:MAG TPA: YkgJ family cysteine cluster protein [Chitinophagaceae bacterium]